MCTGKTGTSTSTQQAGVQTPGNVQAWGTDVFGRAVNAASTPFQPYGGEFVAPINQQQTAGISGVNNAAGTYAPYAAAALNPLGQGLSQGFGGTSAAMGATAANAQLDPMSVSRWMSPYISNVVQATENQQNRQNAIQQSQLESSAINSGAFGGDRSGVAAANLAYDQNMANQPTIANLFNTGFTQALGEANQQQQTGLSAAGQYGNLANQMFSQGLGGASAISGLGTTAQGNQLGAANAQIGAGTLQQQTQQAQDQALYNQFLQQQAYPFQTTQFLANILGGVAPLYGSTTTSTGSQTTPMSFFADGGRVGKADGGGLSDVDAMARMLQAHGAMYAPRVPDAGQGPYGAGLSTHPTQIPTAQLPSMGRERPDTGAGNAIRSLNSTADFGKNLSGLYSAGKDAAVGSPASTANGKTTPASSGWFGYGGKWGAQAPGSTPAPAPSTASPTVYTNADGKLVDASGNPVLPDGTAITDSLASGGRVGFDSGGAALSDDVLRRIIAETFGKHHQEARNDADNPLWPSRKRGRMAFGLAPETPPVTVAATPPALPAYEPPEKTAMPGLSHYWPGPPTPPSVPAPSRGAMPPVDAPSTPPVTVNASAPQGLSSTGANGGFWDRLRRTLEPSPGGLPERYAQGERVLEFADGGRAGLSSGGMPYAGGISNQYIPDDLAEPDKGGELMRALESKGSGGGGGGGGSMSSGLGSTIGTLGNIAKLGATVASFFERGGRIGKDDGGGLSDMGEIIGAHGDMYDKPPGEDKRDTGDGGKTTPQIPTAQPPSMNFGPPTKSGLGDAIGMAAKLAPLLMAARHGGRIHKDEGGALSTPAPEAPPPIDPKVAYKHNIGNITSPNGGFNGYATPEEGVAAAVRNAQAYQKKFNEGKPLSLMQIAERWAPKDDGKNPMLRGNDPAVWAGNVAKFMNVKPTDPVDINDPRLASTFAQGVHRAEKPAGSEFDPAVYDRGVQVAFSGKPLTTIMGAGHLQSSAPDPNTQVAALGPALQMPPPSTAPKQSWWDKESGGLSGTERGIISLLSGLGGMASSPSRFFGGAALAGLGAGATTYGQLAQKGKALDISQQQANTAVGRLGIEGVKQSVELYNKLLTMAQAAARNGQQPPEWLTSQLHSLSQTLYGYMPGQGQGLSAGQGPPSGGPGPGGSPPALPTPTPIAPTPASGGSASPPSPAPPAAQAPPPGASPSAPPQVAAVMPKMDFSQLPNEKNPDWLMERSREQGQLGNGEAADKFRHEAQALYDKYGNEGHAMVNGQVVAIPGWDQMQAWKQRIPENQKYMNEQADQAIARNRARQQLNTISKVMEEYQTGALSDLKASAQALGRALGIDVPNTAGMNSAAYQEFMKSAIRNAFADVKDMGGKPLVTEIENSMQATANPSLQPEANRKIMAMLYGQLDQADKFGKEFGNATSANPGIQRQQFAADWLNKKENDLTALADERERGLAVRGATPSSPKDFKEGATYIIEPNQFPGVTERGKYKVVRKGSQMGLEKVQ